MQRFSIILHSFANELKHPLKQTIMKLINTLTILLFSTILFTACSGDDDPTPDTNNDDSNSNNSAKVSSIIVTYLSNDSVVTLTPEFDSQGRLTKDFLLFGQEVRYTYSGDDMTEEVYLDDELLSKSTFTLNEMGYPASGVDDDDDILTFSYDSDGKMLVSKSVADDNSATIIDTINWVNGSINTRSTDQFFTSNTNNGAYEFTLSDLDAKGPAVQHYQNWVFIGGLPEWGNHGKKLVAGNTEAEYTFETDGDGNLTKIIDEDNYTVEFTF